MISLRNITKSYQMGDQEIQVLKGISLDIFPGDFVAIMGQSGSGKSTLMNIIGMLDIPSSGEYIFEEERVEHLTGDQQAEIRRMKIGFVFQSYNLLPRIPAIKQVALPLMYKGVDPVIRYEKAKKSLEQVGLGEKLNNKPSELSGGQQQRISIARAMVGDPFLILADEPTGALDSKTSEEIMNIFTHLNSLGKTIVIITHEMEIAQYAKKIIHVSDGLILSS